MSSFPTDGLDFVTALVAGIRATLLVITLGVGALATAPVEANCRREVRFLKPRWTSLPLPVPITLRDPVLLEAFQRESFRQLLLEQKAQVSGAPRNNVITDFKQIADAIPVGEIKLLRPRQAQKLSDHEILSYILRNYRLPSEGSEAPVSLSQFPREIPTLRTEDLPNGSRLRSAVEHLHRHWGALLRSSSAPDGSTRLPVPKPYAVAGGRFREFYFWDSLWIMKGLLVSGYHRIALGMLENMVSLFETYGIIPNGNRFYYLSRTQVPVFMEMVHLLADRQLLRFDRVAAGELGTTSLEARVLAVAEGYYQQVWRQSPRFNQRYGLYSYFDSAGGQVRDQRTVVIRPERGLQEPATQETIEKRIMAESGWDFSYTRFGTTPGDWLPVDLNALMFGYLGHLAHYETMAGRESQARRYRSDQADLGRRIREHLWDREQGLFLDRNARTGAISTTVSAASFFPLYVGLATKAEGAVQVRNLLALLKPPGHLGVHTTNKEGDGQWDGGWSWAPLNEIAFQTARRYGLEREAREIATDNAFMSIRQYLRDGHFYEKQRAKDGDIRIPLGSEIYGNEQGFGWTNGSALVFLEYLFRTGGLPELERRLNDQ